MVCKHEPFFAHPSFALTDLAERFLIRYMERCVESFWLKTCSAIYNDFDMMPAGRWQSYTLRATQIVFLHLEKSWKSLWMYVQVGVFFESPIISLQPGTLLEHHTTFSPVKMHAFCVEVLSVNTDTFTHKGFHTQALVHVHTKMLLHTRSCTHRLFSAETLLHTKLFACRRFYTQTLLHRRFYTQMLVHTDAPTLRPLHRTS